ncbi:MAG TPA: hypothetical protein VHX65_18205 [Pirellulales bacterium]|jgi:hypothetical protein|nr:hypothetical protein [Pirellulales bacterium]
MFSGLLAAAVLLRATPTLAGPPLVTNDPDTPGANGYEFDVSDDVTKTRDVLIQAAPFLDLNYGTNDHNQFTAEFPLINYVSSENGGEPTAGFGDLELGYKDRFIDEKDYGISISTFPQVLIPTGNKATGVGGGLTELLLPLEFGKHFFDKKLYVYGEAQYYLSLSGSRYSSFFSGIAAEYDATKKFSLMAEFADFTFPEHGLPDDPFFNVGFGYKFSENVALIGSAGRSCRDRETGAPEFMSYLGFQFTGTFKKNKVGEENGNSNPAGERKEP